MSFTSSIASRISDLTFLSPNTTETSVLDVSAPPGVKYPIDTMHVRPFKCIGDSILYVGQDQVKLPPDVLQKWDTEDRERLRTDLEEVAGRIYRRGVKRSLLRRRTPRPEEHGIFIDIRMSGYASRGDQHVTLTPCIWILCGTGWACGVVRAAMEGIIWPKLTFEIHKGVPRPSSAEDIIDIDMLDLTSGITLGEDVTLYINVETRSDASSSFGLLCCATLKQGGTFSHQFSRIGGLVSVNGAPTPFGVSTAHGMLNNPWWHAGIAAYGLSDDGDVYLDGEGDDIESESDFEEEPDDEDNGQRTEGQGFLGGWLAERHQRNDCVGFRDPRLVTEWRNASTGGTLSFLGSSLSTTTRRALSQEPERQPGHHTGLVKDTDHALLDLTNLTVVLQPPCPSLKNTVDQLSLFGYETDEGLNEGPVSILFGNQDVARGELVCGSTCLSISGQMFTLRKVMTTAPLGRLMDHICHDHLSDN